VSEQTFKVSGVSKDSPKDFSFEKDGETIRLKLYHIKLEGSDEIIELLRSPKTAAPKQGDTLIGELQEQRNSRFRRIKVRAERNGIGRTGQTQRQDPREIRANMAAKTAYQTVSQLSHYERGTPPFMDAVRDDAKFLFDVASWLVGE
jgi:hypothetical protein